MAYTITDKKLNSLLKEKVIVIDVRPRSKVKKTGRIPGAYSIPAIEASGKINMTNLFAKLKQLLLSEATPFVLYCDHGQKTGKMLKVLKEKGGYNLCGELQDGFINGWVNKGHEVEFK